MKISRAETCKYLKTVLKSRNMIFTYIHFILMLSPLSRRRKPKMLNNMIKCLKLLHKIENIINKLRTSRKLLNFIAGANYDAILFSLYQRCNMKMQHFVPNSINFMDITEFHFIVVQQKHKTNIDLTPILKRCWQNTVNMFNKD